MIDVIEIPVSDRLGAVFGDWLDSPHIRLRAHRNGTLFLLLTKAGMIHLCELGGNLESDQSRKARRLSDGEIIRLENLQGARFVLV